MIRSSFASFNTAKMAIQANQNALAIVGQNMANVKTTGYTRQRLDLVSLNSNNISASFMAIPQTRIGFGVMVTGVSQIRDPFLDVRYRIEMGNLGSADKRLELLDKIRVTIDENDKSGIVDQFDDLIKQLDKMIGDPSTSKDNMVRSSAQALTSLLNNYAKGLEDTYNYAVTDAENDIKDVNSLLTELQQLNASIKSSQVHGNAALELMDQRNVLLDQLGTYANIDVTTTTEVTINGQKIDSITVDYKAKDGTKIRLIDDVKSAGSLSLRKNGDSYELDITDTAGVTHANKPSDKGTMQSSLSMINDAGEFGGLTTRGIPYYQKTLDEMARKLAEVFNGLNNVPGSPTSGDLFETSDGSANVTARNIIISADWQSGAVTLQRTQNTSPDVPSDDSSNILNMKNALTGTQEFLSDPADPGSTFFKGSFQACYENMEAIHGMDQKATETLLKNYVSITNEVSNSRDSVSGVNLDEEAMDMMQFNSALTAASRYMTTLDEALSTIISSMGTVGR